MTQSHQEFSGVTPLPGPLWAPYWTKKQQLITKVFPVVVLKVRS